MIASSLIELSGQRESDLTSLWDNYMQWCTDNSAFTLTFCFKFLLRHSPCLQSPAASFLYEDAEQSWGLRACISENPQRRISEGHGLLAWACGVQGGPRYKDASRCVAFLHACWALTIGEAPGKCGDGDDSALRGYGGLWAACWVREFVLDAGATSTQR